MRYLVWLIRDDWLGSDWMYLGLRQYEQPTLGRDGNPLIKVDRDTGEKFYVYETFRFWADPGVALLNPGYELWVWGQETAPCEYVAERIQVRPPSMKRCRQM